MPMELHHTEGRVGRTSQKQYCFLAQTEEHRKYRFVTTLSPEQKRKKERKIMGNACGTTRKMSVRI